MATSEIDIIKKQAAALSKDQKEQLIEFLTKSLKNGSRRSERLQFGKYKNTGLRESTEADFSIAEWHPNDAELDGN